VPKTRIGIIVGSIRKKSQSARIATVVKELCEELEREISIDVFSLKEIDLPLWAEEKWESKSGLSMLWKPFSERLKSCDGFVVLSPEWAGMVPPHLKNFLLYCDGGEVAHKPGLLIAISSGLGGAYPIAELRMSGYKNNFLWWTPDHVILRNVETLFVDKTQTKLDVSLISRMKYSLNFLVESAIALGPVREKIQDLKTYKFGM
jgi:azobenzene reductase